VEDWAEIRRLRRSEGMAIQAIARRLRMSRNTVKKALASDSPPRYQRAPAGSIVDVVEPQIRVLLAEFPDMPSTVIMERVGWTRGKTVFCDRVQQLRPLFVPPDPAQRTEYLPGELAQCDLWFPPADVALGFGQTGRPPVLVMVCGYSRWLSATMIATRQSPDLLGGHWTLLSRLGAVPKALVWDNEAAVGQWRGGRPQLTESMNAFRGSLGIRVIQCRPADPESKGLVERANGYLETSFLPGRRFSSPQDFNAQLQDWLVLANNRIHRRLQARPADRVQADRAAMVALPPVAPIVGWRLSTRLPRDHYVRVDANDYSVHPGVIGRRIEVVTDLHRVRAYCDGKLVADHTRIWARHQSLTLPEHDTAAKALRHDRIGLVRPAAAPEVEVRCLADYDSALGIDNTDGVA
jgi:transposase